MDVSGHRHHRGFGRRCAEIRNGRGHAAPFGLAPELGQPSKVLSQIVASGRPSYVVDLGTDRVLLPLTDLVPGQAPVANGAAGSENASRQMDS